MTTTYSVTTPPKHSSMREHDCAFCSHRSLKRPVFITNGTTTFAAGSGCAARLVYGDESRDYIGRIIREADLLEFEQKQAEALQTERQEAYAQAIVDLEAGNDYSADLRRARVTFHKLQTGEGFLEFLARVASTGILEA